MRDSTGVRGKNRFGFTLIELLVVVLIIGILAAVALPQYQKAVARARAVEGLIAIDAGKKAIDMYMLSDGRRKDEDGTSIGVLNEISDVQLPENIEIGCNPGFCSAQFNGKDSAGNLLYLMDTCGYIEDEEVNCGAMYGYSKQGRWYQGCWTNNTGIGKAVCSVLENQGWKMIDGEW